MSTNTIAISRPRAATVREWAVDNGLAQPGQGRLSQKAIDAYNAGRNPMHRYVRDVHVKRHTVKPAKGRAVTRTYDVREARRWALANGWTTPGARGRLSQEALDSYILSLCL